MTKKLCSLRFTAPGAIAQQATVPLIVEGNAPTVELSFTTSPGAVRKAQFLVDTGGSGFIIGSRLMVDLGVIATGPEEREFGDRLQPLAPFPARLGAMNLDLTGVRVFGMPDNVHTMLRNDVDGLLPAGLLRKYEVVFDCSCRTSLVRSLAVQRLGCMPSCSFTRSRPKTLTDIALIGPLSQRILMAFYARLPSCACVQTRRIEE